MPDEIVPTEHHSPEIEQLLKLALATSPSAVDLVMSSLHAPKKASHVTTPEEKAARRLKDIHAKKAKRKQNQSKKSVKINRR